MGAEEWAYFVPYEPNISEALNKLRKREFEAGRYSPCCERCPFLPDAKSGGPGAGHASIEEAIRSAGASGTASILDIHSVGEEPEDFQDGVVVPLAVDTLADLFGTEQPTREAILESRDALDGFDRGQGLYVVAYEEGVPSAIFFRGLSYD
jgi:hypothetical protein